MIEEPRAARWRSAPSEAGGPFGGVLFFVSFVPRLVAALLLPAEPVWDGHYYDFGAKRIAAGAGYSDDLVIAGHTVWHPWCHYPVGYSAFLAPFYRLLGPGVHVAPVVNAWTGALLAVVTWALARRGLSEGRARVAGLIVGLHPGLILYTALVMTEPLAALLTLASFWAAVRDSRPLRGLVVGALVLGVAALVRPQALMCAPFLALALARDGDADGEGSSGAARPRVLPWWIASALACVLALVPVLPWTARNCRVMDGCTLVSTNVGWNLAIGAFPRATGRFETLRSSDGCRDVTGQVQQDRCWLAYAVSQIEENPRRWLGLIPAKLGFTFDHESFAVEYLREAKPRRWPEGRREAVRDFTTLVQRVLVCAAAFGVVALVLRARSRRRAEVVVQGALLAAALVLVALACAQPPSFWPLVAFASLVPWLPLPGRAAWPPALKLPVALLATTAVTHAIFFGEDRYHIVVVPVLAILAAAAGRTPAAEPPLTET